MGRGLTLGRSPSADVILLDLACSRAHARIERRAEGYALVDLGSANGTWLDGVRMAPHQPRLLDDHDQFLTGEILFELVCTAAAAPAQPAAPSLTGDLEQLALAELVELLEMTGKSGVLRVRSGASKGELCFAEGQVCDVRGEVLDPEEAFYRLSRLRQGRFEFHEGPPALVRRLRRPTRQLLVEAARRLDEQR